MVKFILWGEGDGCREPPYAEQRQVAQVSKVRKHEPDGGCDHPVTDVRAPAIVPRHRTCVHLDLANRFRTYGGPAGAAWTEILLPRR